MFNFFKKQPKYINPITKTQVGTHGDHWGSYYGFGYYTDIVKQMLNNSSNDLLKKSVKIPKTNLAYLIDKDDNISAILIKNDIISIYPDLKVGMTYDMKLNSIVEWSHVGGVEALVKANLEIGAGLTFFATDYIKNKQIYLTSEHLQIQLFAFAYLIEISDESDVPENFSPDFVGLVNRDIKLDEYNFIGRVEEVKKVDYIEGVDSYIVAVAIIDNGEEKVVIDMYMNQINYPNLKIDSLKKGDKISGTFWFQGRIKN